MQCVLTERYNRTLGGSTGHPPWVRHLSAREPTTITTIMQPPTTRRLGELEPGEDRMSGMDDGMTRRTALTSAALGAGAAALSGTQATAQGAPRKTFVLIHGAWHGGWCWRHVADLLEAKGHKVYAPSLTGNGDRSHLLS